MRLIRLEILNLASLDRQEGETICFEEGALKESTIFSIVGPTGSGKSTILDAICLALYNRAPRYPRKKGDRNQNIEIFGEPEEGEKNRLAPTDSRNILTRGKKEGYSKLTFLANNGNMYRAEWYVRFLRAKYDNVITSLYRISTKDGQPTEEVADWKELPMIIGLDYEQFLRTVLIAQGSFANFLTAKENERYELLEKLIGCETLYTDIVTRIKQQKDDAVKAYDAINANFSAYEKDIIPTEETEPLQERIKQLEEEDKRVKEQLVKIDKALTWYVSEAKHIENIEAFTHAQTLAEQHLKEAGAEIDRLKMHDATLPAINLYRDIRNAKANIRKQETDLQALHKETEQLEARLKAEEDTLLELKAAETKSVEALELQRPHINKARTLKGELHAAYHAAQEKEQAKKACEAAIEKARKDIETNTGAINSLTEKLDKAQKDFASLNTEISSRKQSLADKLKEHADALETENNKLKGADAESIQETKSLTGQKLNELKEAIRVRSEIKTRQNTLRENEDSRVQLIRQNKDIEENLKTLHIENLVAELETLRRTHTLMTSENWAMHRHGLETGRPCPLCGATEHQYENGETLVLVVNDLQKLIHEKNRILEEETNRQRELTQAQGEVSGKLQSLDLNQESLQCEIHKLQEEWLPIHTRHPEWSEEPDELKALLPRVEQEAAAASAALSTYNATANKIRKIRDDKEAMEKELKKYTEDSDRLLREAERKLTETDTLLQTEKGKTGNLLAQEKEKCLALDDAVSGWNKAKQAVKIKADALKAEVGDKDPDTFEDELTKAKNEATESVNKKNDVIASHRENLNGLNGKKEAVRNAISNETAICDKNDSTLADWLNHFNSNNHTPPVTVEDIAGLYEAPDNWESIREKQTRLNAALTTANTTLQNERLAHHKHQETKPAYSQEELNEQKTAWEGKSNSELTDAKARMQRHMAAKQHMGVLYNQRLAMEQQKREWEEITDAIGSDGKTLRKIAQCYTLRFLIAHANVEIRKFNSRYELQQVRNSLGIRVIDHDRADDVRDTTSLSGGETFIVSLGLALGLSALSSRNISFENLFIDEGFGTLDPDTLATVIDSLAMLQSSQGKKVGVISHTDTMSERITTQIRIIKNGNSGSSHIKIYPPI